MLFTQEEVKFNCFNTPDYIHLGRKWMHVPTYHLSQVFSNKRAACKENTPTQHIQPAHPSNGAQNPTPSATDDPPWRDTIIKATASHNATSSKIQTPARRLLDASGEAFVSRTLAVLCRRPNSWRSWPNVPRLCGSMLLAQGQADIG